MRGFHRNAVVVLFAAVLLACILRFYVRPPTEPPQVASSDDIYSLAVKGSIGEAVNGVAFKLYFHLTAQQPSANVFFSPLSIASAFARVYIGSRGVTRAEVQKLFGFGIEGVATALLSPEKLIQQGSEDGVELLLANRLYVQEGFSLRREYTKQIPEGNVIEALDFSKDPGGSSKAINRFIKEATRGLIPDVFPEIDPSSTKMVLADAIFFDGKWQQEFDTNRTRRKQFRGFDETFQVDMMGQWRSTMMFADVTPLTRKCQIAELPYGNGNTSMFIVLPIHLGREAFNEVEEALQAVELKDLLNSLYSANAEVLIPKFEISESIDLTKTLPKLGVADVFDKKADLSGFTDKRLFVSAATHDAKIKVDEKGTLSAAATEVTLGALSGPRSFVADHPFIFFIVDKSSPTILFIGTIKQFSTGVVK